MKAAVMKNLVRITCVLIVALLGACGGGGGEAPGPTAATPADTRLVMDTMSWDQGDWAD
jgi:hypothetical protein